MTLPAPLFPESTGSQVASVVQVALRNRIASRQRAAIIKPQFFTVVSSAFLLEATVSLCARRQTSEQIIRIIQAGRDRIENRLNNSRPSAQLAFEQPAALHPEGWPPETIGITSSACQRAVRIGPSLPAYSAPACLQPAAFVFEIHVRTPAASCAAMMNYRKTTRSTSTSGPRRWRAAALVVRIILGLAAAIRTADEMASTTIDPAAAGYVNPRLCFGCHAEIYERICRRRWPSFCTPDPRTRSRIHLNKSFRARKRSTSKCSSAAATISAAINSA